MQFKFGQKIIDKIRGKKPRDYNISYSQDGEDLVLVSLLRNKFSINYKGYYVDIGAYHPLTFSNTKIFYDIGWRGINIDATPGSMSAFEKMRPLDTNIVAGIADKKGEMYYHMFEEPALNCFDETIANDRINEGWALLERKVIKTYPINDILEKHLPLGQQIDFIDIDVEGYEFQILSQFDFEKYAPCYFLTEALEYQNEDFFEYQHNEVFKLLSSKGYKVVAKTMRTIIWKKIN